MPELVIKGNAKMLVPRAVVRAPTKSPAERLLELAQSIFEEADVDKSGEVEAGPLKGSVLHAASNAPS